MRSTQRTRAITDKVTTGARYKSELFEFGSGVTGVVADMVLSTVTEARSNTSFVPKLQRCGNDGEEWLRKR